MSVAMSVMTSSEPENFADVVRSLRKTVDETQVVFAERFQRSRTYITNTERGELSAELFVQDLINAFPAEKNRIEAAYQVSLAQRPQKARRGRETQLQRKVDDLLHGGRFSDAEHELERGLNQNHDCEQRHWMYERLHVALLAKNQEAAANEALIEAIGCAADANLKAEEISSRERLAGHYQTKDMLPAAIDVLDGGLERYPDAADLWLRMGKVRWYEEQYSHAYAALTTALHYGNPKYSVLHIRSQVLAEWENFDAALADVADYLSCANIEPANEAHVRSARAYIWGQMGDLKRALAEFATVSPFIPHCGWLHYRRAQCYITAHKVDAALFDLLNALPCEGPPLDKRRRGHAESTLREHGLAPPFP
jgi:hypothetical protein